MWIDCKKTAIFVGGVLFGTAGLRLLSSREARKVYTHTAAAALRMKDAVMETVTGVQEKAADILADAQELNSTCARANAPEVISDESGSTEEPLESEEE